MNKKNLLNEYNQASIVNKTEAVSFINNFPEFEKLTPEQKTALAQYVAFQNSADALKKEALIAKYNFDELRASFLAGLNSEYTKKSYCKVINDFTAYCKTKGADPLSFVSFSNCDNYIIYLRSTPVKNKMLSSGTIRQHYKILSAFFSFIERQTAGAVKNCFRGCRVIPKKQPVRVEAGVGKFYKIAVTPEYLADVETDIDALASCNLVTQKGREFGLIIEIIKATGLRAGAFSSFCFKSTHFAVHSKGKTLRGSLPLALYLKLKSAGLPEVDPCFPSWSNSKLCNYFKWFSNQLYSSGAIAYPYSVHDLRHWFACKKYFELKDIYKVSKLLGHSAVSTTEVYLAGLHVL